MLKPLLLAAALLSAGPALAQADGALIARMQSDWADFDAACRGTTPSQGSDGFCGARAYIGWVLAEQGICLSENPTGRDIWAACGKGAYATPDPIGAQLRADF